MPKDLKRQERQNKIQEMKLIGGHPTHTAAEKIKLEVFSSCLESLEDSINQNADSSQSLATKVFWLNVILTIATVAGVVIAIFEISQ